MDDHHPLIDEGLELLTEDECWDLLARTGVGRVGITINAMPAIFPVNYTVIDRSIVFRTAPGTKFAAATAGAVIAFEIDEHRAADRSGWSVLAIGRARVAHDVDLTAKAARLEPWADGTRTNVVRIDPEFMSGRRLVH